MKIKIEHSVDHFRADSLDLPGSPPVGLGETKEEAVACLFYRMLFESTDGEFPKQWITYIKKGEPIEVDGKIWDWPKSYKRPEKSS